MVCQWMMARSVIVHRTSIKSCTGSKSTSINSSLQTVTSLMGSLLVMARVVHFNLSFLLLSFVLKCWTWFPDQYGMEWMLLINTSSCMPYSKDDLLIKLAGLRRYKYFVSKHISKWKYYLFIYLFIYLWFIYFYLFGYSFIICLLVCLFVCVSGRNSRMVTTSDSQAPNRGFESRHESVGSSKTIPRGSQVRQWCLDSPSRKWVHAGEVTIAVGLPVTRVSECME